MAVNRKRIRHKRDRLRRLQAFCHAARFESISRSAECLAISKSTVSLHVRELEHELGAVLFDRIGSRIALTEAGKRLYGLAMPLVEAMDALSASFPGEIDGQTSGEIHLAAGPSAAAFVLPAILKRFRDEYPGVRLRVTNALVKHGLELLSVGEADFVVGPKEPDAESFSYHGAFTYNLVLITPEDHPLAGRASVDIREASQYPTIVPPAGTYNRQFGESNAHRLGVETTVAIEASGWGVIKSYVEAGIGISVVPSLCLTEQNRVWRIPFEEDSPPRSYGIFTRRDRPLSPYARRLVRMIAPDFPDPS